MNLKTILAFFLILNSFSFTTIAQDINNRVRKGINYIDLCEGWNIFDGPEVGYVRCQKNVTKFGTSTLEVSRANVTWKNLQTSLKGLIEFSAWVLPAKDYNTNFSIRLGSTNNQREAIYVEINESNRWFYREINKGQIPLTNYKLDWTHIVIIINTLNSTYSLWIDGVQYVQNVKAIYDIGTGINTIGLMSGRGTSGHPSYVEGIVLREVK